MVLLVISLNTAAQETEPGAFRKFSIGFDFFTDFWQNPPAVLDAKWYNRGVNTNILVNNQIGESRFDFSYGISIGVHNLYTDAWAVDRNWKTVFEKIPDTLKHEKYKITMAYCDFPDRKSVV